MSSDLMTLAVVAAIAAILFVVGTLRRVRFVGRGVTMDGDLWWRGLLGTLPAPHRMVSRPGVWLCHVILTFGLGVLALRLGVLTLRILEPGFTPLVETPMRAARWAALREWTLLAMMAATGFLALRRWVLKPRFLALTTGHEFDLFWLALVLSADLLHTSAHSALLLQAEVEVTGSIGPALGQILVGTGLYQSELLGLDRFGLWLAVGGSLLAVGTMPLARNTHRLSGWLGVLRGQRVRTALEAPAPVSRKHLLDALNCTECGQCDAACAERHGRQALRPSQLPVALRGVSLRTSGDGLGAAWLAVAGEATVSRCDGCGDCDARCPLSISLVDALLTLRDQAGLPRWPTTVESQEDE